MLRHHSSSSRALGFFPFFFFSLISPKQSCHKCGNILLVSPDVSKLRSSLRVECRNREAASSPRQTPSLLVLLWAVISPSSWRGEFLTIWRGQGSLDASHAETNTRFMFFKGHKLNSCWCKMVGFKKRSSTYCYFALKCAHDVWMERSFKPQFVPQKCCRYIQVQLSVW